VREQQQGFQEQFKLKKLAQQQKKAADRQTAADKFALESMPRWSAHGFYQDGILFLHRETFYEMGISDLVRILVS